MDDFEIEDIIKQAKDSGMFSSKAKGGLTPPDFFKPSSGRIVSLSCLFMFHVKNP